MWIYFWPQFTVDTVVGFPMDFDITNKPAPENQVLEGRLPLRSSNDTC